MKDAREFMKDVKAVKAVNEIRDEENPAYLFQTTYSKLVLAIALGKLNAKKLAQQQMANLGLDKKGNWIGFDEAKKLWKV